MNIFRRIAANTLWLFAAHLSSRLSNLAVTLILSRYLGAGGFGAYSFVCAYVGFFIVLTDMGIDLWITREASRDLHHSEDVVGCAIVLKTLLSCAAFALSIGTAVLIGVPTDKVVLILIAGLGLLLAPLTLYGSAFSATLQLHLPARFEILGRVLLIGLVSLVVVIRGSLRSVLAAVVLPGALVAFLNLVYARRIFRPRLAFRRAMALEILAKALPIAALLLFTQLLLRIDQLMLEWLCGDRELGLYAAAVKCCEALNVIPAVFIASIFPLLSRTAGDSRESFTKVYGLSLKYLSLVLVPLITILSLYPGEILRACFGREFAEGARALGILSWSSLVVAAGYVVMTATISLGSQKALLGITGAAALFNVVLNLLFIPQPDPFGGANGAALATLVSYSSSIALILLFPDVRPFGAAFLKHALKPLAALVPAVCAVRIGSMGVGAGVLVTGAVYALSIVTLRGLDEADYRYLRSVFRRQ